MSDLAIVWTRLKQCEGEEFRTVQGLDSLTQFEMNNSFSSRTDYQIGQVRNL